jgi:hypothetical protein
VSVVPLLTATVPATVPLPVNVPPAPVTAVFAKEPFTLLNVPLLTVVAPV